MKLPEKYYIEDKKVMKIYEPNYTTLPDVDGVKPDTEDVLVDRVGKTQEEVLLET